MSHMLYLMRHVKNSIEFDFKRLLGILVGIPKSGARFAAEAIIVKPKRVAIYTRISTSEQRADLQVNELTEYAQFRKWQIVGTYADRVSGAKDKRPALDRLMADARRGRFDVVACWRFDRFARSTSHLLKGLEEFAALGIDFVSLRESIDTSTPTGKMIFTILASVAELERCTIRERVIAGQKAAKRRGVRFGRPTVEVDTDRALKLRKQGLSWRDISAEVGVPKDTLIRHCEAQ
jgi:DNA invertase Pin-like site-specific DNA recombinase